MTYNLTEDELDEIYCALEPIAKIADKYEENLLDDEARRFWGENLEHENETPHNEIELYTGRGGRRLLTLADCFCARAVIRKLEK